MERKTTYRIQNLDRMNSVSPNMISIISDYLNGITATNIGEHNPLCKHDYGFVYINCVLCLVQIVHNLITIFGRALELYRFFNESSTKNLLQIIVNSEVEED
ncbi:hypothetical protein C2G38_2177527 [Gigaspora rosea]|uniref:Uncharacterized protein n=1 Tax=Gigaspora rosea TaxID=44941 RepID=A0A397VF54_9GLOM|nr:hypothetical protein C2G38_2177527 [Gigaspora rosea]